jgi:hypothetical protein
MGSWPVLGRYQAKQGVSQQNKCMDSTDKSTGGTEFQTHDISALDLKTDMLPLCNQLTQYQIPIFGILS